MLQKLWSLVTPRPPHPPASPQRKRALVLENDAIVAGLLVEALKSEGFRVEIVRTTSELPLLVRRQAVDLIYLDGAGNPSISDTIRDLRTIAGPQELTIVAASDAPANSRSATALIAAGADDCLGKPLVLSEIRNRVQARLRGRNRPTTNIELDRVAPGAVLDGKFRLEEELGHGNFGRVFSARHLNLERQVAIKILHNKFSSREEIERRLRREGISTCHIDHPNAVKVFDLNLTPGGLPYLVMEFLRGRSLADELAAAPGRRLPLERAAAILIPVCRVLAESHRLGMLHLDIKPANIFLHRRKDEEVVKVLDFGIVRMMSAGDQESPEISTSSFEGSPSFASLERLLREPFGPKADIYSVGVVLYSMLTGRLPLAEARNPIHLISLAMAEKYPSLATLRPELPEALTELCDRCLSADPDTRPTAAELAELLAPIAASAATPTAASAAKPTAASRPAETPS